MSAPSSTDDQKSAPNHADAARRVLQLEADALRRLAEAPPPRFGQAVDVIAETRGRVILSGMGKSGHIARKIAATLSSTGRPAFYLHPGEASHGDLGAVTGRDALIALSWSGETSELSDLLVHARSLPIPTIAITGAEDGYLARSSDVALVLPSVEEACRVTAAPTTSTTMMLALGDALAVAQLEATGFTAADFRRYHPGGRLGAVLASARHVMHAGDALPLLGPDASTREMIVEMTAKRLGCVGVVDGDGRLIGVVTDGDLRRRMDDAFFEKAVADVMTADPRTIAPDAAAVEVLQFFNEKAITNAFVVEDGAPVGLIHIHDLLRLGLSA